MASAARPDFPFSEGPAAPSTGCARSSRGRGGDRPWRSNATAPVALGIPPIDAALGGGLASGALHEIAAARETRDRRGLRLRAGARRSLSRTGSAPARSSSIAGSGATGVLWIAEDLSLAENGAPYGPGLDEAGIAPERLITVAAARARDVLWAMEEALRCRAVGVVIGEIRARGIDLVATRRLSLAAAAGNTLGAAPAHRARRGAFRRRHPLDHRRGASSPARASTASVRRAWPRVWCATAVVISEPGSWSGTVWSSVSSSQRILSLWLERLSTDRIRAAVSSVERCGCSSPRRLRQARQSRPAGRGRRRGGAARAAPRPRAGAGARHASGACRRAGGSAGRCAPARRHRRLVPALHAARRRRSARRHPARHRRLRASVRRRGASCATTCSRG